MEVAPSNEQLAQEVTKRLIRAKDVCERYTVLEKDFQSQDSQNQQLKEELRILTEQLSVLLDEKGNLHGMSQVNHQKVEALNGENLQLQESILKEKILADQLKQSIESTVPQIASYEVENEELKKN